MTGRRVMATARRLIVPVAVLPTLVAACGSSAPKAAQRESGAPAASVRVARSKLGRILVDSRGRTLYLLTADRRGRSSCYSGCARLWPPATVSGHPIAGPGLTAKLTTTRRRDHTRQLVYNGHPLYTLVADTRPGQTNGQGYSGTWFVLSPAGHQIGHGTPVGDY